jgi:signal transduction histidine kinase
VKTSIPLLTVAIRREHDLPQLRQRTRMISSMLGFSHSDATKITTAVSEISRNAFEYAKGGSVTFAVESLPNDRQELVIRVVDTGDGIEDFATVLSPEFTSRTGLGIGIRGSRTLMDRFDVASAVGRGTTVTMAKTIPRSASGFGSQQAAELSEKLAKATEATPLGELQVQNQALLNTLQELSERQAEIERLSEVAANARVRAEAAQLVAERSLVVRDRFMALTTHELRTPLNAIIGYMDLLEMELAKAMTEKQKGYFGRVKRASKHLLGVTNDFLDMAQGDAGRLKVSNASEPARHVIAEATALVLPQATARNVTVQLDERAEEMTYFGDVNRVRQVLVNVLGNAVSFSPAGTTVKIVAARAAAPPRGSAIASNQGPWCIIEVRDSGPGIPSDKIAHVFEPFVQLSSDGQATRKGSGLGLTVSRQLALLMGGELTVRSEGEGAVFTLWLPETCGADNAGARDTTDPADLELQEAR